MHSSVISLVALLQNITINGELVDLPASNTSIQMDQSALPIPGCRSHDLCSEVKCQNGGHCVDQWTLQYCECPDGFIGRSSKIRRFGLTDAVTVLLLVL